MEECEERFKEEEVEEILCKINELYPQIHQEDASMTAAEEECK